MKSYVFKVVIEEDQFEDGRVGFSAHCPSLEGAYTWGETRDQALQRIKDAVKLIVDRKVICSILSNSITGKPWKDYLKAQTKSDSARADSLKNDTLKLMQRAKTGWELRRERDTKRTALRRANAEKLGYRGTFYPWTSASAGDLESECHSVDPPHCRTQVHLQGDIALAAWQ